VHEKPIIDLNLEQALEKNFNNPKFNEFRAGDFNFQLSDNPKIFTEMLTYDNLKIFTELYYQRNNSENIVGTNARLGINNIEFGLGGKISISDSYSLEKYIFNACLGINLNLFKFGIDYNLAIDACNGKREDSFSFNATFSL